MNIYYDRLLWKPQTYQQKRAHQFWDTNYDSPQIFFCIKLLPNIFHLGIFFISYVSLFNSLYKLSLEGSWFLWTSQMSSYIHGDIHLFATRVQFLSDMRNEFEESENFCYLIPLDNGLDINLNVSRNLIWVMIDMKIVFVYEMYFWSM